MTWSALGEFCKTSSLVFVRGHHRGVCLGKMISVLALFWYFPTHRLPTTVWDKIMIITLSFYEDDMTTDLVEYHFRTDWNGSKPLGAWFGTRHWSSALPRTESWLLKHCSFNVSFASGSGSHYIFHIMAITKSCWRGFYIFLSTVKQKLTSRSRENRRENGPNGCGPRRRRSPSWERHQLFALCWYVCHFVTHW